MLITCQDVTLGYEGQAVVRNLSFSVESGDYLWVVGENGSGKTTLIKGLLRLLSPFEGSIVFSGELSRQKIGYLSQQMVLKKDFPAGVHEVVISGNLGGMGLRPFYNAREKKRADEAMEQLGITDLKKKCYRELSGGQQRRVLLARALCAAQADSQKAVESGNSQMLLVLDEPAAGLDPLVTSEVYGLLKNLNQNNGITIIMVSHDTRGAEQYANRILHMENGKGFFFEIDDYLGSEMGKRLFGRNKEKNDDN